MGVREIFIVTGWRADVIENHFGDGKKFGAQISFGRQLVQDGTGKAPELAKDFVGNSPFLLTYGDILVAPETYPQMLRRFGEGDFAGGSTWPVAARARALTDSTRRNPSESAWLNSPMASIEASASE